MTQPTLPNRKSPVFVRCPVCDAEFWRSSSRQRLVEQLWCSRDCARAARRHSRGATTEHPIAGKEPP
jgi:hypothetical protein